MSGMKDYVKVILTTLLTALLTLTLTGAFNYPKTIRKELKAVEIKANDYTDKKLIEHEKVHIEVNRQYEQIQKDLNIIKTHLINKTN